MILHWSFDPILFSVGPLAFRWYGLMFVGAFFLGQYLMGRMCVAEGVEKRQAERLLLTSVIASVVGARLVHCLFYEPELYLAHPLYILRIWEGGLASHGGVLGLLAGLWICARTAKPPLPLLWLLDRICIPAAFGGAIIRLANFLNSEIVGLPTAGGWGVVFDSVDQLPRHPTQLYEALAYLLIGALLALLYRHWQRKPPPGLLLGVALALVFSARIGLEFFKVPQAAYEAGQVFTVGQYLSLPFVAIGLFLVLRSWRT